MASFVIWNQSKHNYRGLFRFTGNGFIYCHSKGTYLRGQKDNHNSLGFSLEGKPSLVLSDRIIRHRSWYGQSDITQGLDSSFVLHLSIFRPCYKSFYCLKTNPGIKLFTHLGEQYIAFVSQFNFSYMQVRYRKWSPHLLKRLILMFVYPQCPVVLFWPYKPTMNWTSSPWLTDDWIGPWM